MRRLWAVIGTIGLTASLAAALEMNKPAPDFTGKGSDGKDYHLADYRGKFVVLQWYNRDCPFIHKYYYDSRIFYLQ